MDGSIMLAPTRTRTAPPDLAELQPLLRGRLLVPGSAGYDHERAGFNKILADSRPAAIVVAAGAADVVAAVRFAADSGLPVAVQATGHGVAVSADGALLISTRAMSGVRVDPRAHTARVEAGARWSDVIPEAAAFGFAPLNGASPSVGVVSYTLGGGHGPLGRCYGYAADHVRNLDLVTADGELRIVSPDHHPDLFWGLRGGRGNFGVVTSMEIDLFEVSRLYGGALFLPGESAAEVLRGWLDWTRTVPDAMQSALAFIGFPDIDVLPAPIRGRFLAHVRIAFNGPAVDGERWVRPLREITEPVLDLVRDMPYTEVASINMDPTEPAVYYERSARLGSLDDAGMSALLGFVREAAQAPRPGIELRHLGGALARPPARANALPFRDTEYSLFAGGPVTTVKDMAATHDFQQRLVDAMAPWRIGGPFLSFISARENTADDLRSAYEPETYRRLVALKDTYDPANLFRINHNIPPTGLGS
jgi:FAD/FMN-containing dehydrogenase